MLKIRFINFSSPALKIVKAIQYSVQCTTGFFMQNAMFFLWGGGVGGRGKMKLRCRGITVKGRGEREVSIKHGVKGLRVTYFWGF